MSGGRRAGVKRDCVCPRANHRHGTRRGYDADKCRCFDCRMANAIAKAAYAAGGKPVSEGKVPNAGTQRRLRALHAVGHTWKSIGERLGVNVQSVREIAGLSVQHPWEFCFVDTARRVEALYEEWWNVSPAGTAAHRARLSAKRKGYLPPAAWDDDTIDDPEAVSLEADPATLTYAQRLRLAVVLVEYGATQKQAAKRCRLADDTIRKMMRGEAA
jgi:hypothetical protein